MSHPSKDELHRHRVLPFGAEPILGQGVRFRLWAPACEEVGLKLEDGPELPMVAEGDGWFGVSTELARPGSFYRYRIGDLLVPDPASRFQPQDVAGPSEVVDPDEFRWSDRGWAGRPWEETVLYELHVGSFSATGNFAGVAERLDHLVEIGVTAVEIMPVADFPGRCNWGYDGVLPFAPDSQYGRPDDLKQLVQTCHVKGISVFLDVVYNHFGPEGNYLHLYAPQFFTDRHHTPWGAAINFDGPSSGPVRSFFIENALYWLTEYHMDGLRLDAVHAIIDDSPKSILVELAERVRETIRDRHVHLVLENDDNRATLLERVTYPPVVPRACADIRPRWYSAQWNDDVHHTLRVLTSGERAGYYEDYARRPLDFLGRALAEGFAYQGEASIHRGGRPRGEGSAHLPSTAFVSFIQNHDQVGNNAFGLRLQSLADPGAVKVAAVIYLLSPQIPLLFMGEEWGTRTPFPFFADFHGELADQVREGRRREFARFPEFRDETLRDRIPDPIGPATQDMARLDWSELDLPEHRDWMEFYRQLLDVRRREIMPRLAGLSGHCGRHRVVGSVLTVEWRLADGSDLVLTAQFPSAAVERPAVESVAVPAAPEAARSLFRAEWTGRSVAYHLIENGTP